MPLCIYSVPRPLTSPRAFAAGNFKEANSLYTRAYVFPSFPSPHIPPLHRDHLLNSDASRIQCDPTNPAFFTNRAFTRIKLEAWDGCLADSLKAIDLFPPDDKPTPIKMKAYYYLAQAQAALHRPGEGLSSAQRAYEMCLALGTRDAPHLAALVLRIKKDKWEVSEGERLRRSNALLRSVEDALRLKREQAEAALEEASEATTTDDDAETIEDARAAISERYEDDIKEVRRTFAAADPAQLGRREVPDYLIDNITFAVMYDPVITKHGHSYERSTIEAHLRKSQTDPLTRDPLTIHDLRPNLALRQAAAEFIHENGWAVDW